MRRKIETVRGRQRRPIATATLLPMPNLAITPPTPCLPLATRQWKKKKTIQTGLLQRHLAVSITPKLTILNKERLWSHYPHTSIRKAETGAEKLPASKRSPLYRCKSGDIPGKGVRSLWGQFSMRASLYAPPTLNTLDSNQGP